MESPTILVLTGPTASGKSGLALRLAESARKQNRNCVIINADSQQLFRELRILTARPTPEEEAQAPHKLYGFLPVEQPCSAGAWLRLAKMEIDWALAQGSLPVVVGGSGLYLKALLEGIADIPAIAAEVRAQAASDYLEMGQVAFAGRLREIDPAFFARLPITDRQRLLRAYEVWLGTGKTLSWWQEQPVAVPYPAHYFHIFQVDLPRAALYRRCDARFAGMLEAGAPEEVRQLHAGGLLDHENVRKIIGVKELNAYMNSEISLEQATLTAQQATRNYAKRQLTWFRHQLKSAVPVADWAALSHNLHF